MTDIRAEEASNASPEGTLRTTRDMLSAFMHRIPLSIALAVTLVVTAVVTGTAWATASEVTQLTWAAGLPSTINNGQWWTVVTALLIPWDPFQLVAGVVASILLLGVAERRMGSWRALLVFIVTGALGVVIGTTLQGFGSLAGEWWAVGTSLDLTLDPLSGIVGALVAATAFMGSLWRRRVRVVTVAFLLVFVLYDDDSSNVYRLIAVIVGYLLGALLANDRSSLSLRRSSQRETRTLVAAFVAVTGVGPIVAFVNKSELTPFAFGSFLFEDQPADIDVLSRTCGDVGPFSEDCLRQLALLSSDGPGMLLLSLVPVFLLLLAAWGLMRGRRFGWLLAIAVNVAIVVFARTALDLANTLNEVEAGQWSAFDTGELIVWGIAVALLPIGIIVLLVATRRNFRIRSPHAPFRRFLGVTLGSLLVLAAGYFVVGMATIGSYWPTAGPGALLIDTVKRFVPPHFLAATDPIVLPSDDFANLLFDWVGGVFWAIFIVAAVVLMRSSTARVNEPDEQHLRTLLRRHGGGTLGFMTTWPGNIPWFSEDGEAAVAYRVINGIAITMSDPICAPGRAELTITEFTAFCDSNHWVPVFYSVHPQYIPIFERIGWQHVSVGEETLIHTTDLELTGKPWQKVRQALNRGIKEGMTTVWTSWDELPLAAVVAINAISEAWVAEKELPEMGFTLGAMEELKDPEVKLMLALDPEGGIQAITSWLPVYRNDAVVGWTIDFMRRGENSMNGIMEFLIASAALHMKETGAEVLSLSGAPLATKPLVDGEQPPEATVMTRLLDWLAVTLEPAYGFSSLFRFKAKFNPAYETISMAYPDALALPTIGLAIAKAYLPEVSPKEALALVRTLSR